MGIAALQIKVMPESPDIDLEQIKIKVQEELTKAGAVKINKVEEQEIAFGLKALIVTLAWPEDKETELALDSIKKVENVSSADITDYRRAFG